MKKTRVYFLLLIFIFLAPAFLGAVDFGFLLNQHLGFGYTEVDDNFVEYKAGLVPYLSMLIGKNGSFYTSASMMLGYKDEFYFYPELLRTEFEMNLGAIGISAGRIAYADPLTYIAEGLFDGFRVTHTSAMGRFGFGAWYTGLQFKKSANITMTDDDQALFSSSLDYGDFANTYFAPRRFLAALGWEHLSIAGLLRINAAILGQFDATKSDGSYHNQYFIVKTGIRLNSLLFEAGGSMEIAQIKYYSRDNLGQVVVDSNYTSKLGFLGELGVYWTVPTEFRSRLSFVGWFAGGHKNDTLGAFVPVTTKSYGEILKAKLTALSAFTLDYSARVMDSVGAGVSASYFIRNDKVTANTYPMTSAATDKSMLGMELFARLTWSPFSDLQIGLDGGMFLPQMGNVWKDGKVLWKIDLTAVLAIY